MAEQDWLNPYAPASAQPAPPSVAPRYELRPLTAGEVLDRTFSLYRSNFWFFVGLSSITAGVAVFANILRMVVLHFSGKPILSLTPNYSPTVIAIGVVEGLLALGAYCLTQAATISGVNALYLGEHTSIGIAFKNASNHWLRYVGIAFWQGWSAIWLIFLLVVPIALISALKLTSLTWLIAVLAFGIFGAVIYGIIAYIRNSLAVPAAVMEDLGVRAAIRRSKQLIAGRKFRIFLLILLVYCLYLIAGLIELPIGAALGYRVIQHGDSGTLLLQASLLVVNFLATSLVGPVAAIGISLFYIDERVRREGFDIEYLLLGATKATPTAPPPPEPIILTEAPSQPSENTDLPEQI